MGCDDAEQVQLRLVDGLVLGAVSGLVADWLMYPMETLKVRAQTTKAQVTLRSILDSVAAGGLYRGFVVPLWFSLPSHALYFGAYHQIERKTSRPWIGALCAEMLAALIWTPQDNLKQRCQLFGGHAGSEYVSSESMKQAYVDIVSKHGRAGLFRGYGISVATYAPFAVIYFESFERLMPKDAQQRKSQTILQCARAGFCAGALAALCTAPIDIVKTRFQMRSGDYEMMSSWRTILNAVETVKLRTIWGSAVLRAMWLAPSAGITISCFEVLKNSRQNGALEL